jgi:hypothetical protein
VSEGQYQPGDRASKEHEQGFRAAYRLRDDVANDPTWINAYEYAAQYRLGIRELDAIGAVLVYRDETAGSHE